MNGISSSAASHFLATWAQEPGSTLLAIAPDEEAAQAMAEEIETLAKALLGQSIRTAVLPSWEQSPYSSISPSIRTRLGRIRAISQVFSDQPPQVIITTLAAGLQRTLPLRALRERSLRVAVGASVDSRERVVTHLLAAGYLRSDPVEDPGTFAVRGDIIDVFPPDRDVPLRIELFGDEIEKIREFDPETQRATAENAPSAVILGPARETSLDPGAIPRLRERIKARADDAGIPRSVRDPIVEQLGSEIYPSHSEFWASFQYAESPCFFQLFHESYPGARVGVVDELSCDQTWDEQLAEFKRQETESIKDGLILPDVSGLFCLEETLGRVATRGPVVYLDRIEMANLESVGETPEEPDAEEKISTRHKSFVRFNSDLGQGGKHRLDELEPKIKLWMKQGFRTVVLAATPSQAERLTYLLQERGIAIAPSGHPPDPSRITIAEGTLREGYRWPSEGWVVVTDSEILGSKAVHRRKRGSSSSGSAAKDWSNLQALTDLSVGDAVVHFDHGIGRYQGIVRLDITGAANDFLLLEYANKDKLYLPVYRLNVIQKYMGAGGEGAPLDKLGGPQFAKAKEKVREAVRKIAFDLVQLYAERQIRAGLRLSPRDSSYREFEAKFPFDETPDQLRAIDAALDDMESGRVMDRLVCGDVGYGKTEVAIRAAYAAVNDGHQVAVLVPTTVLAHQHELSFRNRMKDLPIRIESVSRFKSAKEQKEIIQGVESGKIDIVVGTHRLLSKDVRFKNLALVIVDEEHRFGVEHKEKLKTLRVNTHAMTLSATPIPRTLHMALSGLREISLINTAPVDRLPIRTYVSRFDEALIQRAVQTELARGGQVFFVHNRVQTIFETAKLIQDLVPQAQIGVGHGQMGEGKLEEVMMDFYQKKTNVLVCTTIIESGIDIPSANTIVIDRADAFGLAQLYQLRGRVGRGQARAYAYLLLPAEGSITEDAKKRLEVIQKFVELGSGFAIASHDLEIRGGGDLLGAAQSGHIETVGFELYTELLEEAVREIQGKPLSAEDSHREPEIKVPFSAVLSETYVPDVHQRLSLYRRLSGTTQEQQIDDIEIELQDRYGPLPEEAKNLLWLIRVKQLLKVLGIDALTVGPERVVLTPGNGSKLDPVRAIALVSGHGKRYQLTPDSKFIAQVKTLSLKDLYFTVSTLLKDLLPR